MPSRSTKQGIFIACWAPALFSRSAKSHLLDWTCKRWSRPRKSAFPADETSIKSKLPDIFRHTWRQIDIYSMRSQLFSCVPGYPSAQAEMTRAGRVELTSPGYTSLILLPFYWIQLPSTRLYNSRNEASFIGNAELNYCSMPILEYENRSDRAIFYLVILLLLVFHSLEYNYCLLKRIIQDMKLPHRENAELKYCSMPKLEKEEQIRQNFFRLVIPLSIDSHFLKINYSPCNFIFLRMKFPI